MRTASFRHCPFTNLSSTSMERCVSDNDNLGPRDISSKALTARPRALPTCPQRQWDDRPGHNHKPHPLRAPGRSLSTLCKGLVRGMGGGRELLHGTLPPPLR